MPARPGIQLVQGAGWVDLSSHVAEGRREDGVRFKATTDDSGLTVVEHADGRQDAIARPAAIRLQLGTDAADVPPSRDTCNCCSKPHDECWRSMRRRRGGR